MRALLGGIILAAALAAPTRAAAPAAQSLWQEMYLWDALLTARDRQARSQSDPAMIPVMKAIAGQVAQQVANLGQIDAYVKSQQDNLRYAFSQEDPQPSLDTIGANFETLSKGADQIRNNLYFLTVRCRIASTQALPDPEMYQTALLILGQVQQLQLRLNSLYLNTNDAHKLVSDNGWATDRNFRHRSEYLMKSVVRVQDSVFAVYNAGYELAMRSR
jgi:hypothetical protein